VIDTIATARTERAGIIREDARERQEVKGRPEPASPPDLKAGVR
jgi:hypothetical protein